MASQLVEDMIWSFLKPLFVFLFSHMNRLLIKKHTGHVATVADYLKKNRNKYCSAVNVSFFFLTHLKSIHFLIFFPLSLFAVCSPFN